VKPVLLDLFCGAGGAAMGYHRAGFDVVGVDIAPQPHYPFEFHQANALEFPIVGFSAIHASPPCQAYTHARHMGNRGKKDHPRLIAPIRRRLISSFLPYVIENVERADTELINPHMLCGSAFGLDVQRHRLFETNFPMMSPGCAHGVWKRGRFEGTPRIDGTRPKSKIVNPLASGCTHEEFAEAMGIDWVPKRGKRPAPELHEAIPPAYTEYIGGFLMQAVMGMAA
jgi:DNA (cytosine-5)-methyltransferase 1